MGFMQKVRGVGTLPWMPTPSESPAGVAVAPEGAVCQGCGYALVNLAQGKCPECGRALDPNDPRSLGPRRHAALEAAANFALPWWITAVITLWGIWLLSGSSYPGGWASDIAVLRWYPFVIACALLVVLPVPVKLVACLVAWRLRVLGPRRWTKSFVPVLILASLITCQRTGAIWWLRWMPCRNDFVALSATPTTHTAPLRIGTFNIRTITVLPDSTIVCQLGFPDIDSDQPMQLRHGPSAIQQRGPAEVPLTHGWVFWMDPF